MGRQKPGFGPSAYEFQTEICKSVEQPILNVGCKEDPASLGKLYGATNLDILDFDTFTNTDLKRLKNFVHGSVLDVETLFSEKQFQTCVLGEFLEHCLVEFAHEVIETLWRFLPVGGKLVLTFPLDDRAPEQQHGKHQLFVMCGTNDNPQFTTYHQTVWEPKLLKELFARGWVIERQDPVTYGFCPRGGWGMVVRKVETDGYPGQRQINNEEERLDGSKQA